MAQDASVKLKAALTSIRSAAARGVVDAAGEIRRQSVKSTPVDTGNLRKTAEIYIDGNASANPHATDHTRTVAVRYTAPYSGFVHNASGKGRGKPRRPPHRGYYWDPAGAEPKFLEHAAEAVFPRIEAYVKRRVKQVMPRA